MRQEPMMKPSEAWFGWGAMSEQSRGTADSRVPDRVPSRRLRANLFKAIGLLVLFAPLTVLPVRGQTPAGRKLPTTLADLSASIEELARKASPAVVQISVRSRAPVESDDSGRAGFVSNRETSGSGVIVDSDGYIVTNAHVVQGAHHIDVSVIAPNTPDLPDDHKHFDAKTIGVDRETDVALLKIDARNLPTLSFLDSDKLKQGQLAVALGSPLGLANSLTVGYISAPVRHLRPEHPMYYVQTDAAINPGNSGGPLLDTAGRIAGINTLILSQSGGSEGIGFAIPSNLVKQVYRQLRTEGRVRRGSIGIIPDDITPVMAAALGIEHHSGVILSDVKPHSSAEAAGLQQGDIVRGVDGKPVRETLQLSTAIFQHAIDDQVVLDILRGKEQMQVKVVLMEKPPSPASLTELADDDENLVRQLGILALTVDEKVNGILPGLRRLTGVAVAAIPYEFAGLNPGLSTGDVIYELNGARINSLEELRTALAAKKVRDPIALLIERHGQLQYVTLELEF
jgi:serine protease Do